MDHSDFPEQQAFLSKAAKRQQRKEAGDKNRQRVLEARSPKQAELMKLLDRYPVVFAIGSAGSGKTYVTARHALQRLTKKAIDRIVITRPTIAAQRHRMGYLPGTDEQKMQPWLVPIMDAFSDGASPADMQKFRNEKKIEVLPFEHMRGRTIRDGVFILDEGQNCTFSDLEMFMTRVGEGAQIVICGDPDQTDLGEDSGLATIVKIAEEYGLNAGVMIFGEDDVVRSETAAEWVKAFKQHKAANGTGHELAAHAMMRGKRAA